MGSLFDGIGGWQLAAINAGVKPLWSSEIEKFPVAVTRKHYPGTLQLGDIRRIDGAKIPPVDIICAGSPCQDLSIAGKQEGLKGARSGLFRRAVDVVRQMRQASGGEYPRFFVWENVPGAFSSNRGADFRAVLAEIGQTEIPVPANGKWANAGMAELPDCQIAWRVLDAQYWGVPQRRKRIFLVADFGGRRAAEILFERESLSRDFDTGRKTRQGTAAGTGKGTREASARNITCYDMTHADEVLRPVTGDKSNTLNARMGTGGNQVPVIFSLEGNGARPSHKGNGYNASGKMYTLNTIEHHAVAYGTVRRLTPKECERLQGLPDDYTLIDDKTCSDTARYKALGNGMAQPCADWVIKRIAEMGGGYEA